MEIILIFLFTILFWLIIYGICVYKNTNNKNNTNDEVDSVDEIDVNIGDVFVYEPLRTMSDPFENFSADDVASRTYIIDDLKTNSEGVLWIKYHSLATHRRKTGFYSTSSIDSFLWRSYKRNELKHLFE